MKFSYSLLVTYVLERNWGMYEFECVYVPVWERGGERIDVTYLIIICMCTDVIIGISTEHVSVWACVSMIAAAGLEFRFVIVLFISVVC